MLSPCRSCSQCQDRAFWLGLVKRWQSLERQKLQQALRLRDKSRSPLRRRSELGRGLVGFGQLGYTARRSDTKKPRSSVGVGIDRGRRGSSNAGPLIGALEMPIKGQHKFCSISGSGKQMALRMLPNRSKVSGSSPGVSDGSCEANCKLCLCASADCRWLVLASNRWADTRGLSRSPWNSGGRDDHAWWVLAVGGPYQGQSKKRGLARG
jgi:hypothetical protein